MRNRAIYLVFLALLSIVLFGHKAEAQSAPARPSGGGGSTVVFYWPPAPIDALLPKVRPQWMKNQVKIAIDERVVATITQGRSVAVRVSPGTRYAETKTGFDLGISKALFDYKGTPIKAPGGGTAFVEIRYSQYFELIQRSSSEAKRDMAEMKKYQ